MAGRLLGWSGRPSREPVVWMTHTQTHIQGIDLHCLYVSMCVYVYASHITVSHFFRLLLV